MEIEWANPQRLIDLYVHFSDEDKSTFRHLLGQCLTAEQFLLVLDALPLIEQERAVRMLDQGIIHVAMPQLILAAIRKAREHPKAEEVELARMVEKEVAEYLRDTTELVKAEVKKARDRKSNPETIKRNVEICDKRKSNSRKWTYGRLAKEYKIARQTVVRIVSEEAKWRRLAAQL